MTVHTLADLGGAIEDYMPVIDNTTDMPAAAGNTAMADVAAMTQTAVQCRAVIAYDISTSAWVISSWTAQWGAVRSLAAPALAHPSAGTFTVTWPAEVQNEIPEGSPGYAGLQPLALVGCLAQMMCTSAACTAQASIPSPNVLTITTFDASGAVADPPTDGSASISVLAL